MKPSLVIALHGLGACGDDLRPLQAMLGLNDVPWLFPDAPTIPVQINAGMQMPAWFDLYGLSPNDPVDTKGIAQSARYVHQLLAEQQAKGVDIQRALLLGFSQGGVVALHAALSAPKPVAAVIGLSTWLPAHTQLTPVTETLAQTPIWLGHGWDDDIVPMAAHERAVMRLSELGVSSVTTCHYAMTHSIVNNELADAAAWLATLA